MLTSLDEYMSHGVHIGSNMSNTYSKWFIQSSRNDGIKIIDIKKTDERLKILLNLLLNEDLNKMLLIGEKEKCQKGGNAFL